MIPRRAYERIKRLAEQFPAILILGPRQCGKTTLVKNFVKGQYFDLEKPSDFQVLSSDIEYALKRLPEPVIFDEAQVLPPLFPVLRAVIDESRKKHGRFFLLGSVSPELMKKISESLAGRVGIVELTPFIYGEIHDKTGGALRQLWIRGGFPDAYLAKSASEWNEWHENYTRTFIERDMARHGLKLSAIEVRRLIEMVAHCHAGILNASDLGRSLGCTYHTIQHMLDILEGYYLIRRLPPYYVNLGKRLVKAPKLYVRDSGLLHYLSGIRSEIELLKSPKRGNSFEGFMIEQTMAREALKHPGSRFYYYRTHVGVEIDLVLDRGQTRIGYEFKCSSHISSDDSKHLRMGMADGIIHEGKVVYLGDKSFAISDSISAIGAGEFLLGKSQA